MYSPADDDALLGFKRLFDFFILDDDQGDIQPTEWLAELCDFEETSSFEILEEAVELAVCVGDTVGYLELILVVFGVELKRELETRNTM